MESVKKGKIIIWIIIAIILLIDIATTVLTSVLYYQAGDTTGANIVLWQGLVRFLLTIVLLYCLYKGHNWAKWISIILFGLGTLSIVLSKATYSNALTIAHGLIMSGIFLISIFYLLFNKSIKSFLNMQQEKRTKHN